MTPITVKEKHMFIRKRWIPFTVFVVVIISISLYHLIQTQTPKDPIVIYKPVKPLEKPTEPSTEETLVSDTLQSGHFHDDGARHAEPHETPSTTNDYDWQEDNALNASRTNAAPWKRNEVSDETDPLQTWQNTEDPLSRAELLHIQLLKHFGDRPEVHTIRNYQIDAANGIPSTIDKEIGYLEAHYILWGDESFLRAIEDLRKLEKEGAKIVFR